MESEYGVAGAKATLMVLIWTSAFDDRLTEFDYCRFGIDAPHAFKGAPILALFVSRVDTRHKHRHSTLRAATFSQRWWICRIKPVRLRHGALPPLHRRERTNLSVTDACRQSLGR